MEYTKAGSTHVQDGGKRGSPTFGSASTAASRRKRSSHSLQKNLTYKYFKNNYVKRPKYRNKSCRCLSDHWHQSVLEADYCSELYLLKRGRKIRDYSIQYKIEVIVGDKHITNHFVDFRVVNNEGLPEFHEVKGYETEVWKIKRRLVEALYPNIPYVVKK